ncbi:alpha-amylase family glycosyl hydrolase [Escherichia coli]
MECLVRVTTISRALFLALVMKVNTACLRQKCWAMVLHGMQGTPYIYQAEEIGMTNPHFTRITDYRDVESLNTFAELRNDGRDADELLVILASKSRDTEPTPMQWKNGDNAGFTAGEPWIWPAITINKST